MLSAQNCNRFLLLPLSLSSPRPLIDFSSSLKERRGGGQGGEGKPTERRKADLVPEPLPGDSRAGGPGRHPAGGSRPRRYGSSSPAAGVGAPPCCCSPSSRCSPRSPLACWRRGCLAPGPPPRRPPGPAPRPRPRRRRSSSCSFSPGRAARPARVCATDRGGTERCGVRGTWTMRTRRPRVPHPGAEHMAAVPPRSALGFSPKSAGPRHFLRR